MIHGHSAIVAWAFVNGLSVKQAVALFDDAVFEQLGYYQYWRLGKAYLLKDAQTCGIDITEEFDRWMEAGICWYNPMHPGSAVFSHGRRLDVGGGVRFSRYFAVEALVRVGMGVVSHGDSGNILTLRNSSFTAVTNPSLVFRPFKNLALSVGYAQRSQTIGNREFASSTELEFSGYSATMRVTL